MRFTVPGMTRSPKTFVVLMLCAFLTSRVSTSNAAPLVSDDFNYPSLNGANGGTGWSNAWNITIYGSGFTYITSGLSDQNLRNSGGAAWLIGNQGHGYAEAGRSLDISTNGALSALVDFNGN